MFRFSIEAPPGCRRDNEATRILRDFELLALRKEGPFLYTKRHGASMQFRILVGKNGPVGRGTVTWQDGDGVGPARFVMTGEVWREMLAVLLIVAAAPAVDFFRRGSFDLGLYALTTGAIEVMLVVAAGLRMLWLRGKLADLIMGRGSGPAATRRAA